MDKFTYYFVVVGYLSRKKVDISKHDTIQEAFEAFAKIKRAMPDTYFKIVTRRMLNG